MQKSKWQRYHCTAMGPFVGFGEGTTKGFVEMSSFSENLQEPHCQRLEVWKALFQHLEIVCPGRQKALQLEQLASWT